MVRINGWNKLDRVPPALTDGDNFHGIWVKDGRYLFIVDDNFGEYIIGFKWASQMSDPEIIGRASTKALAVKKAVNYMRLHPNG